MTKFFLFGNYDNADDPESEKVTELLVNHDADAFELFFQHFTADGAFNIGWNNVAVC